MTVTGPFRRARETRRERNEECPASPSRIQLHPIRSDRGSCRRHGRPPIVPCQFWCRDSGVHLEVQAEVQAPDPSALRDATQRSPGARWSSHPGVRASAARTRSSAISARIMVAEIGASSVTERVTDFRLAKRTRTVTVRPGLDFARSRLPIRSARCSRVGLKTCSSAGFLPIADCAPADRARRPTLISRRSRFHASAASFSPAAGPSNRSSDHPGVFASCPIVSTPISASRAFVIGPTPHINSTGKR